MGQFCAPESPNDLICRRDHRRPASACKREDSYVPFVTTERRYRRRMDVVPKGGELAKTYNSPVVVQLLREEMVGRVASEEWDEEGGDDRVAAKSDQPGQPERHRKPRSL